MRVAAPTFVPIHRPVSSSIRSLRPLPPLFFAYLFPPSPSHLTHPSASLPPSPAPSSLALFSLTSTHAFRAQLPSPITPPRPYLSLIHLCPPSLLILLLILLLFISSFLSFSSHPSPSLHHILPLLLISLYLTFSPPPARPLTSPKLAFSPSNEPPSCVSISFHRAVLVLTHRPSQLVPLRTPSPPLARPPLTFVHPPFACSHRAGVTRR